MSTSKHTISQVKDILRKLDRSIDDARARRLRPAINGHASPHEARIASATPPAATGIPNLRHM